MPQERIQSNDENFTGNEGDQAPEGEKPLTDAQKIVRRHLEDEDHVITEEEMRNIRVGVTPTELDAPTQARFSDNAKKEKIEDEMLGTDNEIEDEENSKRDKLTPWDTIERD